MAKYDKEARAFNLKKFNAKHRMFKVYLDKKEDAAIIEHLDSHKNKSKAIRQLLNGAIIPVELDESVIQETLNKRCMTAVANEYLIALHGKRPQGEWIFKKFDEETGISNSDWCPFCGKVKAQVYDNFCGNCGAQLRGK